MFWQRLRMFDWPSSMNLRLSKKKATTNTLTFTLTKTAQCKDGINVPAHLESSFFSVVKRNTQQLDFRQVNYQPKRFQATREVVLFVDRGSPSKHLEKGTYDKFTMFAQRPLLKNNVIVEVNRPKQFQQSSSNDPQAEGCSTKSMHRRTSSERKHVLTKEFSHLTLWVEDADVRIFQTVVTDAQVFVCFVKIIRFAYKIQLVRSNTWTTHDRHP